MKPISREHHHGLLLCWKIRTGAKKNIAADRIKRYMDWFYETHLVPHFQIEEKYIFSLLDAEDDLIQRALAEHDQLRRAFEDKTISIPRIQWTEKTLQNHIRFEERVLFPKIEHFASEEQLRQIDMHHSETKFIENSDDVFWL